MSYVHMVKLGSWNVRNVPGTLVEQFSNPDWNKMERSFGFPTAAIYGNCVERSRMFQERSMCSAESREFFRRSGNFI